MQDLNAKINTWHTDAEAIAQEFQTAFGNITAEGLNWKPNPSSWSIAQVTDHLITVDTSFLKIIDAIRNGDTTIPWFGRVSFVPRTLGRLILKSVQPDTKRKTQTFPIWEPASSSFPADIIARFAAHQQVLCGGITHSSDLLERGTVIHSPASRIIVYPLATAFDIIIAHQRRHLLQAERVKAQLIPTP